MHLPCHRETRPADRWPVRDGFGISSRPPVAWPIPAMSTPHDPRQLTGVLYASAAFLFWGLAPLYWRLLEGISAQELLAHRIVWALPLLAVLVATRGSWRELVGALSHPRTRTLLLLTTVLIAGNWFTFLYAIVVGKVLQASLGYYLTPLVNVLLGVVFLHERLRRWQLAALVVAGSGVALLVLRLGELPWISLVLASSFAFYGLLRKQVAAGPMTGLSIEIALLFPAALGLLLWMEARGGAAFGHEGAWTSALLVLAGAVTVTPLLWFTRGARAITLVTLGFLQFLAPTGQFLLAVFAFHEPFGSVQLGAFCLIWTGLALYSWEGYRVHRDRGTPRAALRSP